MKKYIINDVEYTLEQISSAANDNGVDIDTYINDMGAQVVTDAVEDPVEKPKAVAKETVPATAETVDTDLQSVNGFSEPKSKLKKEDFLQESFVGNILGYGENETNSQGDKFTYDVVEKEAEDSTQKSKEYIWNNSTDEDVLEQPWYTLMSHHPDFADKTLLGGLVDIYSKRSEIKENKRRAALGQGDLFEDNVLQFARRNGINNLDVAREKFQRQYDVDSGNAIEVDVELDSDPGKFKLTEKDYDEAGKLKADLTVSESMNNSAKNVLVELEKNIPNVGLDLAGTISKYLGSNVVPKSVTEDLATYATELERERLFNPSFSLVEALEGKRDKNGDLVAGAAVVGAGLNLATTMIPAVLTKGRSLAPQIAIPMISEYNKAQAEAKGMNVVEYYESGNIDIATPLMYSLPAIGLEKLGYKGINKAIIAAAGKNKAAATTAKALSSMGTEAWTEWLQTGIESFNSAKGSEASDEEAATLAAQTMFSEEGLESALQGAVGSGVTIGVGGVGRKTLKALRATRTGVDVEGIEEDVNLIESLRIKKAEATDKDVIDGIEQQIQETKERLKYRVTKGNGLIDSLGENEIDEIASMSDLAALQQKRVLEIKNKLDANEITEDEYSSAYEGFKSSYVKAKNRIKGIVEEAEQRTPEDVSERTVKNADAINNAFNSETMQRVNEKTGKKELTAKGLEFFHNVLVPNMSDLVTVIANRKHRENKEFGESKYKKSDFIADLLYSPDANVASSLIGLLTSFNSKKDQFLTTYITKNLEFRSKRILEERVGSQATIGGTSIDTQEARELAGEDIDVEVSSTKGPRFAKKLGLSDELINKARNAAKKALSTAKKVDDKKFLSDLVNTINNDIFNDIRDLIPKPKEREAFMEQFAGTIWDAMPQSSIAKATRNETFKKWGMEAPTKEAFVDYFLGRDQEGLGLSTINDRVKKQLPQYLAKAIGAEYAQDLLENDADTRERFGLTQKQEVEDAAKEIVENDDSSWFDYKKFQESTEVSEDDAAAQTKDWNKQLPDGEETLVIQGKEAKHEKAKEEFRNWVKTVMSKYFPKEFFFIAESGHLTNSSSRMAFANKESVASELESSKFAEDSSGINWNLVGRIDYKGLGQQAKIYARGLFKGKNKAEVTLADLKKNWKSIQAQGAENMKVLKFATKQFAKMYADDKSTAKFIATWYKSATNNQNHILRFAAPLKAFSKDLSSGMREEHTMPASLVGKYLFNSILNNDVDNAFKNVEKNYFQVALAIADDNKLKGSGFNYTSSMPKGWKFTDNTWARYFNNFVNDNNGGIDPNGIEFFETGKTVAETFGAEATNQTPDVITAQQKVIQEKTEDSVETLIDRAIGKLEDYLGPKGALQANFAAVPINILIGGLRATKLAYKGSKSLAKALEAGYKKVQDYMSQQEWLDFAKQAVTEVKKEKTGATIALAIANENAIKNEQNRQNKIKTLKDAGVYSKSDDSKTSKELDQKLAEEDSKIKESNRTEGMERNFRKILNNKKSTGKRPSKWFIPSNAEDIKGLLYAFLPDGTAGVAAKKFFNSTILKPYSDAVAAAEAEILQLSKKFVQIKEQAKVKLDENIEGTPYTMGDAIKVYNWVKAGVEVDVLKQEYLDRMIGAVEANAEAKYLADEIAANYDIAYDKNWRGVPLNKSIYDAIQEGTRTKHLEIFSQNVDAIFNKDNLQEIENVFGKSYVQALQNSLKRMRSGRNRVSTDAQSNKFLNWINKSVATTMFFNTRSAVLQLLSSLNFIGQKDNNLFKATAAFADQKQWQEDYNKLWNSDYLSNRRDGAKFDVLADEIAEDQESFLNKLLQKGFLPTRYADSFAIALGGAAFYRNRANALMKEGMSKEDAEAQALKDWQNSAEETQQSSDPSKISEIQASTIGKIIYAFANTPFQYARKGKRLLQDVASGRSKAEGGMNQVRKDLQSVFYYTVGQAMLFNALQTALFASMFSDDEEDKLEEKTITAIERILTSYAKSLGNPGAVVGSIYSVLAEANEQIEKRGRIDNAYKLALEATAISPPLNTKLKDIVAIGNIYKYNHKQIEKDPFEVKLDNPVLEIAGNAASFAGYPLDRVIRKAQNLEAAMNEQTEAWEKVFLTLGWSKWELGIDLEDSKFKKPKFNKPKFNKPKFNKPKFKKSPTKKLERGVAGRANNDGTIEIDPNLSPVEREKTIAHEEQHMKDMKAGKLNYDDDYVYWNDGKYERKNGKIKYKGKSYIEGHKDLPWEKKAYAAEPSTAEAKKRTKLYA